VSTEKQTESPRASDPAVGSSELLARITNALKTEELEADDETYKAAAVLLASATLGPNPAAIAKTLKYPSALVAKFNYNLRKSGVWKRGRVFANWGDKETGGVAFWMDVMVAQGLMERARAR